MARMKLPPGFRFHPTDIELVTYYLKRKVYGRAIEFDIVAEVDIYKCEPWDLPEKSLIGSSDPEWYFFSARDKKYANGSRTNRATESGYWKATGKDRTVKTGSHTVGMKKTLVFYKGRAPHGGRTDWVMHEYRLEDDESGRAKLQDAFVLCRVFKKNGIGPNHPENSTPFDFEEETGGTTTEDVPVPDEKPLMSGLEVVPSSIDGSTKENDSSHSEMKDNRTVLNDNPISGAPSSTFATPEESDNDMSLFYDSLLNDPNQYLDNFTTIKQSTSELESLETVMGTEVPASPITAQDFTLWLEAPTSLGELNASASLSGNQLSGFSEYYSPEEADMLDELYRSTLQSQEFKVATQHVGSRTLNSKYAMQTSTLSKTVSEDMYDITEVHNDVFKDELSSLSEQNLSEEGRTLSSKPVSGLEDISEEEMLEELFQLINESKGEGQQSQVEGTEFQGEGATSGVEDDVFFDILQEPNTEAWMQTDLWNEASTSHDWNKDSLEPASSQLEDWLSETLSSSSDLPFSETLPELSGSGLLMQTLYSSSEGQGQTIFQNRTKLPLFPLADSTTTTTKAHMYSLQNSSSKPSKPLSRFSKLLDSVPVLPASAAEFPPHVDKRNFVSKDNSVGNSGRVQSSMQTTSWNARFRAVTIRCGCEFMSGVSKSPSLRFKQQILTSEDKSVLSLNTPIDDMTLSKDSGKGCSFRRHGNGCYSVMFFLGALSAVCWFLLLRLAWRFASHMGSLLT